MRSLKQWSYTRLHDEQHYWSNVMPTLEGTARQEAEKILKAISKEYARRHKPEDDIYDDW